MIIIVRGIFRHFSLHEGQEKQPSLGPQFLPGLFIFSYIHLGNMKILLTMAIVLGALIIVQASSSKEFTLVDTVKTVTVWITWNERFDYTHDYLISPTGRVSLW